MGCDGAARRQLIASWVHGVIEAGRVLRDAQDRLPRGRFASWVESRLRRTRRSAEMLIAIAVDPRIANHGWPPALWRTLYEITRLSDEDFYRLLEAGVIQPEMLRKDLALDGADDDGTKSDDEDNNDDEDNDDDDEDNEDDDEDNEDDEDDENDENDEDDDDAPESQPEPGRPRRDLKIKSCRATFGN